MFPTCLIAFAGGIPENDEERNDMEGVIACRVQCGNVACGMQWLERDWEGAEVYPPMGFSMRLEEEELVMHAQREASASLKPGSRGGEFTPLLWKYDVAEFFLRDREVQPYMEINLAPNGAWWAAVFDDPRVDHPGFDAAAMAVRSRGQCNDLRWEAELHLPLVTLRELGWTLEGLHASACVVLRQKSGSYRYASTSMQTAEKPDFHRPWYWPPVQIQM